MEHIQGRILQQQRLDSDPYMPFFKVSSFHAHYESRVLNDLKRKVPVPKTLQSPGCEDPLLGHWDPREVISKPMWIKRDWTTRYTGGVSTQAKGKDCSHHRQKEISYHTGKNPVKRGRKMTQAHNPVCANLLETEVLTMG